MARQNEIVWKKDLTDIQSGLETLATKTKISIDLSSMNYDKVKKINVVALEIAVNKLEEAFSGNCCQANCCQTCQGCQSCQTCQGCQNCQTCQGCQTCHGCQKCHYYMTKNCNCDCNCDCSDDS